MGKLDSAHVAGILALTACAILIAMNKGFAGIRVKLGD